MTINQKKTLKQDKAVELSKIHNSLCLEFSTGVGKSLAAMRIAEEFFAENPNANGYLICKENTHKKNWKDEFIKHGKLDVLSNLKTFLYASAKNQKKVADIIIFDECHALTMARVIALKRIITDDTVLLFLSATLNDEKKYLISLLRSNTKYYTISLEEAIEIGVLPVPEVEIHHIELDNNNKDVDFVMNKGKAKDRVKKTCLFRERWLYLQKYKAVELTIKCSDSEYYELICKQIEYWQEKSTDYNLETGRRVSYQNTALKLSSVRKRFIAKAKTNYAKKLIQKFKANNKRFICFAGSISQVEELSKNNCIHSKKSKEENQNIIDCFNSKKCSELYTVKMLRESVNLTNIELGLIIQLDSTMISFYQMLGRTLRHDYPKLIMIVLRNTQDEVWFKSSMKGFDRKYIKHIK